MARTARTLIGLSNTALKLRAAHQDDARTAVFCQRCELPSTPVSFKRLFGRPAIYAPTAALL
jgi:hypothetical protein